MSDSTLRQWERLAASGDPAARARLLTEWTRSGALHPDRRHLLDHLHTQPTDLDAWLDPLCGWREPLVAHTLLALTHASTHWLNQPHDGPSPEDLISAAQRGLQGGPASLLEIPYVDDHDHACALAVAQAAIAAATGPDAWPRIATLSPLPLPQWTRTIRHAVAHTLLQDPRHPLTPHDPPSTGSLSLTPYTWGAVEIVLHRPSRSPALRIGSSAPLEHRNPHAQQHIPSLCQDPLHPKLLERGVDDHDYPWELRTLPRCRPFEDWPASSPLTLHYLDDFCTQLQSSQHRELYRTELFVRDAHPLLLTCDLRAWGEALTLPIPRSIAVSYGEDHFGWHLHPVDESSHGTTRARQVYSLGALAYRIHEGRFWASNQGWPGSRSLDHFKRAQTPCPDVFEATPPDLAAVIQRAMHPDPAQRHPDPLTLRNDLRSTGGSLPPDP